MLNWIIQGSNKGELLPTGKHDTEGRERGSVFLQGFQFIPQFHHGLRHNALLCLILGFQIRQSQFSSLRRNKHRRAFLRKNVAYAL